MYETTHHGLNCWSKHMIEKFGWIIIAYTRGYHHKIDNYAMNLKDVHLAIVEKIKKTEEKDRIDDLKILKENIEKMLFFANLMKMSINEHYTKNNENKIIQKKSKKNVKSKST
jgi:hypothetical protein